MSGRDAAGDRSDAIFVTGIEFLASHGYTAAERRGHQRRFRVDIELTADLSASSRTDRLQDTIDYRVIAETVVQIGTTQTFKLLEALAGSIADALQSRWPEASLTITVHKLAPPCEGAPSSSGVRLFRGTGSPPPTSRK